MRSAPSSYTQWLKWRGTQGDTVPHLKYLVVLESVPPHHVSQRTHGDGNGNAYMTKQKSSSITEVEFSTKSTVM